MKNSNCHVDNLLVSVHLKIGLQFDGRMLLLSSSIFDSFEFFSREKCIDSLDMGQQNKQRCLFQK